MLTLVSSSVVVPPSLSKLRNSCVCTGLVSLSLHRKRAEFSFHTGWFTAGRGAIVAKLACGDFVSSPSFSCENSTGLEHRFVYVDEHGGELSLKSYCEDYPTSVASWIL
jgi:hypothetical protein